MRDAWRRDQTWAPRYVADELRGARVMAEEYRRDAIIWSADRDRHPVGSAEPDRGARDIAVAEELADDWATRAQALGRAQAARDDWYERSTPLRERARFAANELERRGLDRDTATAPEERRERSDGAPRRDLAVSHASVDAPVQGAHFDVEPDVVAGSRAEAIDEPAEKPDVTNADRVAEVVAELRARFEDRAGLAGRQRRTRSAADDDEDLGYDYAQIDRSHTCDGAETAAVDQATDFSLG